MSTHLYYFLPSTYFGLKELFKFCICCSHLMEPSSSNLFWFTFICPSDTLNRHFLFLKINLVLFLAVLGFCCCVWAFSSCSEQGLLFLVVHHAGFSCCGARVLRASVVAARGLGSCGSRALESRFSSCGTRA